LYARFLAGGVNTGELDLYNPQTGTGLTQAYLADRSEMLVNLVLRNSSDARIVNPGTLLATDYIDRRLVLETSNGFTREVLKEDKVFVGGGLVRSGARQVAFGSDGVDAFKGSGFADRLYGGGGDDKLVGLGGVDYLQGDQGNDMLEGGVGNDVLDGGYGLDTYLWNLGDGSDTIRDDDGKGFLVVNGRAPGIAFSSGGNTWVSADGKLTLTRNSPLTIHTEDGSQIILEDFQDADFGIRLRSVPADEPTTRTILGDLGPVDFDPATPGVQTQMDDLGNVVTDPNVLAPNRADTLSGSTSADLIQSGGGNDTVTAGAGGDQVQVGPGRDFVNGEAGNDLLEGGAGGDILSGGDGDDRLYAGARGNDALTDMSTAIAAGSGLGTGLQGDWLAGGAGDDILISAADNDVLTGGAGVDLLIGGAGADNLLGDSSYVATSLTWAFTDSAGQRVFSPVVGEANPLDGAADVIYAGAGNDFIRGGRGDDAIYGEGDRDDIAGESGADVIFGGEGNDDLAGDAAYIGGAEHGADYIDGGGGNDTIAGEGGEDVIFGGAGDDAILGDSATLDTVFHGADFIDGGEDDDVINAGGGDDILIGGQGADVLVGGTGNDQLEGGIGADILSGGGGDDRYVADASDSIEDDAGVNTIALAEGDGPESWVLQEMIIGGQPAVVLALAGQAAGLMLHGRFEGFNFEFANGEVLSSGELVYRVATEGRQVLGTAADEILIGTRFDDGLEGFDGNDTLDGREGNDELFGGEGDDVYLFDRGFGTDRIEEFVGFGVDTIRFGANVSAAEVTAARRANGDLVLSLALQDQVTIVGQYRDGARIERIEFGDGVNLTLADLDALPVSPIVGTDGPDSLPGTEGDDTIEGRAGLDTYALGYGTGRDTFIDTDGRIMLQTGLALDGLRALRQGDDLTLLIRGTTEGAIVKDYYVSPQSWTIEDADGAQTTPQAVADATAAREQDWLTAQRDEYRDILKADVIERFLSSGSEFSFVGDGLLYAPWQTSVGASVDALGSWTTTSITTTIYSADGTVTELTPSFESNSAWSIFPKPHMLDFHLAVVNETLVSNKEFIFSTAGLFRAEVVDTVVATVAWDRASADQRADNSTITTTGLLLDGGHFTSTARYSSFSGGVGGQVIAIAPFGSVALSSGLFPEHVEAFLTTVDETWRITDVVAGAGNNTIFGTGMDVIDAGDGNDTASGGFVYGGTGDDVLSGEIAIGGPGNDWVFGDRMHGGAGDDRLLGGFGASRFVFDVEDLGRDIVTDSQGLSVEEFADWYYVSIPIFDWRERLYIPELDDFVSLEEGIALGLLPPLPQIAAHDWNALVPLYAAGVIEVDAVEFRQGISAGDVSLSWSEIGNISPVSGALEAYATLDVSWGLGNVARIVIPHAEDPLGTGVEEFRFADGSVSSMQEMVAAAPPAPIFDPQFGDNVLIGTAFGEVILGRAGNDTLEGGPGEDSLQGGEGDDVYVFAQGDGVDHAFDEGGADRVRLAGGIAPEDVLVIVDPYGAPILTLATGDRLTLSNWFDEATRVESVEFADGTIWDVAELESRMTVVPATEFDDFIGGTSADDVIDGLGGNDQIYGFGGADVLEGSADDDLLLGGAGGDILRGGDGADVLSDDQGNNFFDGSAGDDAIFAYGTPDNALGGSNFVIGGTDNDWIYSLATDNVIAFNAGDGQDMVYALYDLTLSLGAGIEPSSLSLSQDGTDLVLAIGASDSIRLTRQYEPDPQAWPQITLQMFGSVHIYDFSAVIDDFYQSLAGDPLLVEFPLDGVLQAHQTGFSETHALGGPLAYQYGTAGNLSALSDLAMRQVLGDANFGTAPQDIAVPEGNRAPVLGAPIADQSTPEDAAFSFTVPANSFVDVDAGDSLTLAAALADGSAPPAWLTFDPVSRTFSGTPGNGDVDMLNVRVTATDTAGAAASVEFALEVVNVNDTPSLIAPLVEQFGNQNAAFSFQVPGTTFMDTDAGDALSLSAAPTTGGALPAWLAFDSATGTFSGTPSELDAGAMDIRVTATDSAGVSVSDAFTLFVSDASMVNETHVGTRRRDVIVTGFANDLTDAGGGDDIVHAGAGRDIVFGGDGDDWIAGEAGNDVIEGDEGRDRLLGGSGDDALAGGEGNDRLEGGIGGDLYVHEQRGGHDVIEETSADADTLRLGAGITADIVRLSRRHDDLLVDLKGRDGSVTVKGWFASDSKKVETIQFADGTVWGVEDIRGRLKGEARSSGDTHEGDHDDGRHDDRDDHHGKSDDRKHSDHDDDRSDRKGDPITDCLAAYLGRKPQYDFEALALELEHADRNGEAIGAQEIARRWRAVGQYASALANEHDEDARGGAAYRFHEHGLLGGGAFGGGFGYTGSTGMARGSASLRTLQGLEEGFQRIHS
jgi:Ca2+-binding RTX toxin-like protein